MNEPSPLVPQGSFESQAGRKSHVRIAVFSILAIHVVVLGGLLILGCKREDKGTETAVNPPMTNDLNPPPFGDAAATSNIPGQASNIIAALPPAISNTAPPFPNPSEAGLATTHTIAAGDNFATLATKYGVSARAIQAANPDLIPTKLQIGTKVRIPPKVPAAAGNNATPAAPANGTDTYAVKSGDTLGKIATNYHTTVKELQRLNNLPTTQIKVGQKLKLPPKPAPAAGGAVPPAL